MTDRRTIVVTGGAGYVGSVVVSHLLLAGFRVVVLDRLAAGGESLLGFSGRDDFALIPGDVRDAGLLDQALTGAAAVVHLAAIVGEPACAGNEQESRSINLDGARAVLSAIERRRVPRLLLVSTCSNYGVSNPDILADEDAPLNPLGIYARSKVDAELAALQHQGSAAVGVLRLGTICGLSPRMRFDLLVNDMARAVVLGETIRIFAPDAWRPFLHIRDAARVVEWALAAETDLIRGRVFNVVGNNFRKRDLADLVHRHFPDAAIEFTDAIPDLRDYRASGARIQREGGFVPRYGVEDALIEIAAAVKAGAFRHPRWDGYAAAPLAGQ